MNNANVRAYFAVIVFALVLAGFAAVGITQGWAIFQQPESGVTINETVLNQNALEEGAVDLLTVDLSLTLIPPSSTDERRELVIQVTQIDLYLKNNNPDIALEDIRICVDELSVNLDPTDFNDLTLLLSVDEPLCYSPTEADFIEEGFLFGDTNIPEIYALNQTYDDLRLVYDDAQEISLNFWYPYDGFTLRPTVQVGYTIYIDGENIAEPTLTPFFIWEYQTSGTRLWDIDLSTETRSMDEDNTELVLLPGTYEQITLTLQRPLLYRLVLPFFIVLMVLLIGLVPLLGDQDTLVDICAAMLFGIFGLKGILGPAETMGQTILDISLIGLYVVLAFAAALFFINKVRLRGKAEG